MHFSLNDIFNLVMGLLGRNPFTSQRAPVFAMCRKSLQDFEEGCGIAGSYFTKGLCDVVWWIVGQQELDSGK